MPDHSYNLQCSATIGVGDAPGSQSVDLKATAHEVDTGKLLFSFTLFYPGVPDANEIKKIWDKIVVKMAKEGYTATITGDQVTSQQTSWLGINRSGLLLGERLVAHGIDKLVDMGEKLAQSKPGYKKHNTDLA